MWKIWKKKLCPRAPLEQLIAQKKFPPPAVGLVKVREKKIFCEKQAPPRPFPF